jgi:hypothetical protein
MRKSTGQNLLSRQSLESQTSVLQGARKCTKRVSLFTQNHHDTTNEVDLKDVDDGWQQDAKEHRTASLFANDHLSHGQVYFKRHENAPNGCPFSR